MIVIDVNLLVYAYNPVAEQHDAARTWLGHVLAGDETVGLPWGVILGFLRVTTHGRAVSSPLVMDRAIAIVDMWRGLPAVKILERGPRYWPIFQDLLITADVRGGLVTDAHFAALAIENEATFCTNDSDFRRFPGLKLFNPLA